MVGITQTYGVIYPKILRNRFLSYIRFSPKHEFGGFVVEKGKQLLELAKEYR